MPVRARYFIKKGTLTVVEEAEAAVLPAKSSLEQIRRDPHVLGLDQTLLLEQMDVFQHGL